MGRQRVAATRASLAALAFLTGLFALAAAVPVLRLGIWLGDESLLLAYRPHYLAIIARVQREPAVSYDAWQTDGAVTYIVARGSPRRVAFEPAGMLDNWSGIVWDPTHAVTAAHGFDPASGRFHAPAAVTKLFGGDLVGCRRLGGDWFDCSFT